MAYDTDDLLNPVVDVAGHFVLLNVGESSNDHCDLNIVSEVRIWLGVCEAVIDSSQFALAPLDLFLRLGLEEVFGLQI